MREPANAKNTVSIRTPSSASVRVVLQELRVIVLPQLPRNALRVALLAFGVALGAQACAGTNKPPTVAAHTSVRAHTASAHETQPHFTAEVTSNAGEPIATHCSAPSAESCNALDDDCNGVIDDGCGYQSGGAQVTVSWDTGADLDLYVTDPSGETFYYNEQHDHSSLGGRLDHNARGDCRREQDNPRIENAFWPAPPPRGPYRIELHYFSPCEGSGVTQAQLSVAVDGKLIGSYRYTLQPEQRIEALTFEIR